MSGQPERKKGPSILVVDDEAIVRNSLEAWFRDDGYDVDTADSAHAALRMAAEKPYEIALVDIKMPTMDGFELQARFAAEHPGTTIIIMTAYASVVTAVQALKAGAYDYIVKPFDPDELSHLIARAHEHRSLQSENIRLKQSLDAASGAPVIVGVSPAMQRLLELIRRVAPTEAVVLIQGESGTGKELVAQAIHFYSPRRYDPLVAVHCGALAESVLESELFGHEKGAFTGATAAHPGKFEQAAGGTIFLDEIGDVSPHVQVELLRVLEEKRVTRVGGKRAIPVDFRVVTATNRDLRALVEEGAFREELFWRLNVVTIEIPPLRERPEDIPELARHMLERLGRSMNRRGLEFGPGTLEALQKYPWPGNVRELQNAIERAVVLGGSSTISVRDLPRYMHAAPGENGARSLAEVEKAHIKKVLDACDWNISQAARILEVDRGTLYNKIHKFELAQPADRTSEPGG